MNEIKVSKAKLRNEDYKAIIYKLSDEINSYMINDCLVEEYLEDIIEVYKNDFNISEDVLEEVGLIDRFKEKYNSRPTYKTNKELFEDLLEFINCEYDDNGHFNLEDIITKFNKSHDLSPSNDYALTQLRKIFG